MGANIFRDSFAAVRDYEVLGHRRSTAAVDRPDYPQSRHARTCSGHPPPPPPHPLPARTAIPQEVDARNKSGHDGVEGKRRRMPTLTDLPPLLHSA